MLSAVTDTQLQDIQTALNDSNAQVQGVWQQEASNFAIQSQAVGTDAKNQIDQGVTEAATNLHGQTAQFEQAVGQAASSTGQKIITVGGQSSTAMHETTQQMQGGLDEGITNVSNKLGESQVLLQSQQGNAISQSGQAMNQAAREADKSWWEEALSAISSFIGELWNGLVSIFKAIGNAFLWIGKQLINLVWGFIWGEVVFDDVWGAEFFAFLGDLIAGIVVYGDIRDIIKYLIVYPIMGKGPWWLNLLLASVAVLGIIPLFGDALKASVKALLKRLFKTAAKELAEKLGKEIAERLIAELGEEATERLVQELGEDLVKKLAQDLSGQAIQELSEKLGKETLEKLSADLGGQAIQKLAQDLGEDLVKKLSQELGGQAIQELSEKLGKETLKQLATDLQGNAIKQLVADLGADVVKNLAKDLTGKEIQELLAKYGVDAVKWLGKELTGNAVRDVLGRLTSDALNALKDISGKQVNDLLDDLGDDVVNTLATSIKGKGLKELSQLGMFKFDPAKQALLDAGQGAAARSLPSLKGKNLAEMEAALRAAGFTVPNIGERGMEVWTHVDGSIIRVKLGPAALKPPRTVEHLVKEISKNPGKFGKKDIFAKVADNNAVVPAGKNFAKDSLKQWFKKQTGREPNPDEIDALMRVWGDAGHIDIVP